MFQAVSLPIIRSTKLHTASGIIKPILLPGAIVDEMELCSISSTIAAGSTKHNGDVAPQSRQQHWFDNT
jgi:hypothetical protein